VLLRPHDLPFVVILMAIGALAMFVPAAHGFVVRDLHVARMFLYSGALFLILSFLVAIATANYHPRDIARSHLAALVAAYLLLPLMLAVPFAAGVRDTSYLNAWFEMVSSLTTTGATLFDMPGRLTPSLHLWRALVGWLGGFFILLTGLAILAPLNLGGFEVSGQTGAGANVPGTAQMARIPDPSERLWRYARVLFPAYAGLTLVLWIALLIAGDPPLIAVCHAMSTLATSGISPVQGVQRASSGLPGEALILLFLFLAVSRQAWPTAAMTGPRGRLRADPEFRIGLACLIAIPSVLFLRQFVSALEDPAQGVSIVDGLRAGWANIFTVLSFLTTTGFVSVEWAEARVWSGVRTPGLILLALALLGGGVATTAGGVKLLRVYALAKHGQREIERLVYPSSIGGAGVIERRLRKEGAFAAWIFFMLFAVSIAVVLAAFALTGLGFEQALVYTIATLSTTGPLPSVALEAPLGWAALTNVGKLIAALAMVLGRLETLAIIALIAPASWRS
jgi:trk system potassium uptake protein